MKHAPIFRTVALVALVLGALVALGRAYGAITPIAFVLACASVLAPVSAKLHATTGIADLWNPPVWIPGLAEMATRAPGLINSGIVLRHPELDKAASGGGTQADVPFLKEPDYADEIQVEGVKPTVNKLGAGKHVAPMLNRVSAHGHEALAGGVSGTDPVGFALGTMGNVRMRQRQTTLLHVTRGVFGNAAAPNAGAAAFKPLRYDIFTETGAGAVSANLFSSGAFIDTTSIFGEVKEKLLRGAVVAHSVIEAAMLKQDDVEYIRDPSSGKIIMRTYKGLPLFISDLLVRNGGVSGKVYDTYIFLPGAISMGDKPQVDKVGEVASLTRKEDAGTNTIEVFDRTRFILHAQGSKWKGAPAGQSATNAELATEGNWELSFADYRNVGVCCLRTNG